MTNRPTVGVWEFAQAVGALCGLGLVFAGLVGVVLATIGLVAGAALRVMLWAAFA